jgi:hypothetical protein
MFFFLKHAQLSILALLAVYITVNNHINISLETYDMLHLYSLFYVYTLNEVVGVNLHRKMSQKQIIFAFVIDPSRAA